MLEPRSAQATSFTRLERYQEVELWRIAKRFEKETSKCMEGQAITAASVMMGAALEALLILIVNQHPEEAIRTGLAPTRRGVVKPLLTWTLNDLMKVANAADWPLSPRAQQVIGSDRDGLKAKLGNSAEYVRIVRNLVHPAL